MIGMPPYASDGDCDGGGPGAHRSLSPAAPNAARACRLLRQSAPRRRGRRKGLHRLCATGLPTSSDADCDDPRRPGQGVWYMLVLYMPLSESKELKYLKEKATPQRRIRL